MDANRSSDSAGGPLRRIAARLPVYLKDLREDPRWLLTFVFGRVLLLRRLVRALHRTPAAEAAESRILAVSDIEAAVAALERDGLFDALRLEPDIVAALRGFAEATPCFGNIDRRLAFLPDEHAQAESVHGEPILVGHYLRQIDRCTALAAVRDDPVLREIARRYLRAHAIVISARLWWSFPSAGYGEAALKRASQNRLHFDMNDWGSVKFFFYLTDVDTGAGPHAYLRGSHRRRRLRDQLTLFVGKPAEDLLAWYGPRSLTVICGPAGLGFAEDPFGFHMGTVALTRPRLVLEIEYGLSPPTERRYYGAIDGAA